MLFLEMLFAKKAKPAGADAAAPRKA